MSSTSKQTTDICCFQNFVLNNTKTLMVSKQLMEVLGEKRESSENTLIQRYVSIDKFIDSLIHQYFYLAAPKTWEDPFETKYLDCLEGELGSQIYYDDLVNQRNMTIFCVSMTYNNSDNEEASWKAYSENKERVIRVTFDFDKLCSIIDEVDGAGFYVGKVVYMSRKDILSFTNVFGKTDIEKPSSEVIYVNNFCLKQDAYQYEKELRFCKITKDSQHKEKNCYKIEGIDITPAITKITLPPINFKKMPFSEIMEKKAKQLSNYLMFKTIVPNVPVHVSNLYNTTQVEMTSEIVM